jgi:hypothetical protein
MFVYPVRRRLFHCPGAIDTEIVEWNAFAVAPAPGSLRLSTLEHRFADVASAAGFSLSIYDLSAIHNSPVSYIRSAGPAPIHFFALRAVGVATL